MLAAKTAAATTGAETAEAGDDVDDAEAATVDVEDTATGDVAAEAAEEAASNGPAALCTAGSTEEPEPDNIFKATPTTSTAAAATANNTPLFAAFLASAGGARGSCVW